MTFRLLAVLLVAFVGLAVPNSAEARLATRLAARAGGPVQSPVQSPVQVGKVACEPPCITYKSHRHCKFDGCDTYQLVLSVCDPCTGCVVAVPVCVPACCTDSPTVCSHRGIFGRHVVEYRWCCGYEVKVVFDRCGDLTVHTYGL
ncbi:MAG: hypothetical protein SFU86_21545 [Pirellulaceae bacterium]|nr:hypothetical protein [Pirellulaceae bacterium]